MPSTDCQILKPKTQVNMVSITNPREEPSLSSVFPATTEPFCDKSFKGARVCGMFLEGGVSALSFLVVSAVCRIFSGALADTYFSMARTEFARGFNAPVTYFRFTDALIDFSYNGCVLPPPSDTELNALRAHYGTDTINNWLKIGTEKMPLKKEKLTRIEEGICLGASLDFIKQYLEKIRLDMSPLEAIRRNSSRYVMGAPEEAQVTQIFYSALDLATLKKKEYNRINHLLEERKRVAHQWSTSKKNQETEQARTMPSHAIRQRIAELKVEIDKRSRIFRDETLSDEISAMARIRQQQHTIIGSQLGIQIGPARIYVVEKMSPDYRTKFSQFLGELSFGCYLGEFDSERLGGLDSERKRHAISLVKTNREYFLYDPNFGTLVFERNTIAEQLWDLLESFCSQNGLSKLSFSLCSLRH